MISNYFPTSNKWTSQICLIFQVLHIRACSTMPRLSERSGKVGNATENMLLLIILENSTFYLTSFSFRKTVASQNRASIPRVVLLVYLHVNGISLPIKIACNSTFAFYH